VVRALRVGRLEIHGRYDAELHDASLAQLDWEGLSSEELSMMARVLVCVSEQRLRDRDQGPLSSLLRSSRPIHVVVASEASGIEDLSEFHTELGQVVMAHREALVVQHSLLHGDRLADGFVRMAAALRPCVALISVPPPGWGLEMSEAALQGRCSLDLRYDPDAGESWAERFDLVRNPQPSESWPEHELRVVAGEDEVGLRLRFTFADALSMDPAYRHHFLVLPPEATSEVQIELSDWLVGFEPEGDDRRVPFIWVVDSERGLRRAVVSRALALAVRDRQRGWRVLQELGGYRNAFVQRARNEAAEEAEARLAAERSQLVEEHEQALELARSAAARESMERLASVLLRSDGPPMTALAAAAPAVVSEAPVAPAPPPAVEAPPVETSEAAPAEEEDELPAAEAWVDSALCTSCNDCMKINDRMFKYNDDKQAYLADVEAGNFEVLVKAAEACPANCIHPGSPRPGDTSATPELIERAAAYA
jgi:ferredoxin